MHELGDIRLQQLAAFLEVIARYDRLHIEFIEAVFSKESTGFDQTLDFLTGLGLLTVQDNQILPKSGLRRLLKKIREARDSEDIVQRYFALRLLDPRAKTPTIVKQFLCAFNLVGGTYQFAPTTERRLRYSDVRNFLMSLGLVNWDSKNKMYSIAEDWHLEYSGYRGSVAVNVKDLLEAEDVRQEIGEAAELRIMEYERERLASYPELVRQIEHVSITDAGAGYDIRSFDCSPEGERGPVIRLIEVKAVSSASYTFYWTRNEINTAKLHTHNYWLYLLPTQGKNRFRMTCLEIIRDPFRNAFENRTKWERSCELFSFSLLKV